MFKVVTTFAFMAFLGLAVWANRHLDGGMAVQEGEVVITASYNPGPELYARYQRIISQIAISATEMKTSPTEGKKTALMKMREECRDVVVDYNTAVKGMEFNTSTMPPVLNGKTCG